MSGKRALHVEPEPRGRTFEEFCAELSLTSDERAALVWHLAAFRARRTVEKLLIRLDTRPLLASLNDQQRGEK